MAAKAEEANEETSLLSPGESKALGPRVKQVVIAGVGFLTDAYDLFVIDLVLAILHRLDPQIGPHEKALVASATLVGAVAGQLTFGLLGDWLGRRWTFLATCFLIVFGALASACCVWTTAGLSLIHQLAICRFALGFGVGGEYPLAATITAEGTTKERRGRMIAAVFSMQGWGMLLSCVLALLLLALHTPLEWIWRILLAVGAIPVALVICYRAQMQETERFQKAREEEVKRSGGGCLAHLQQAFKIMRCFWHQMIGTTMTWLILDITFYGTGSFKTRITGLLIETNAATAEGQVWHEATFAMFIALMAIPGYLLSILFIDRIGRYRLQLGGFLAMSVNFFLLAYLLDRLGESMRWMLVVFFGLTFLFSNFGPNTTTFVIPAEVYPTLIRSTCHGTSAAAGKVGAVIGAAAFAPMEHAYGLNVVLACCGITCLVGAAFTMGFTDDKVCDLDHLDSDAIAIESEKPTADAKA
eukprot:TRINITY_DN32945_c0_g1_i1.p1 TRINITY_DN32945_c0_g1~~TRINITY_DN32945_c0_g1_i1.p1  ORF type:complete len:471 (-),score=93.18 TRINITY_DN32945_c0_g1_i1:112-1524(-)